MKTYTSTKAVYGFSVRIIFKGMILLVNYVKLLIRVRSINQGEIFIMSKP